MAKSAQELKAETLREIGILLAVFGPIETFFNQGEKHWIGAIICIVVGYMFIRRGIDMEVEQ